jgi:outer membrane protein assembly factor BamD (BamD/ComL family)
MFVKERSMMSYNHYLLKSFISFITCIFSIVAFSQPNTNVSLEKDKPKQYENRTLASEKTGDKKFTLPRRITQNTYTHYNYYFNANNKLNEVITTAKTSFKNDYTFLLPFYNYTLDLTSLSKGDLDSIIYKCTAGVLLHDLRNDWVDNLYMLLGKAYLLRKDFDSAAGCFQYINYTYAPKDEGYDIPLGSNSSGTAGVFTIATNEKRSIWKKITSKPPSRNESFIWQVRNYLEQDLLGEAAGLIGILRNDPFFPKRLKKDLHEVTAYWFYKQQNFDSAAWHLQRCLSNASTKFEKSRWEYLTGQLFQSAKKDSLAIKMFDQSIKHTSDPLMEVYARLNIVNLESGKKKNALQENLNELLKLSRRDKYVDYRDIIFYAAAQLEHKRYNNKEAQKYLLKSVEFSVDNPKQKTLSFIQLAIINYSDKNYLLAHNYYDSIQLQNVPSLSKNDSLKIELRKPALKIISQNINIINREDSLQQIAAKPEIERIAYVKKVLKQLRKEKGLKSSDEESYNISNMPTNNQTDLFGNTSTDFYFNNTGLRGKGFIEFKSKWGKRNNIDNWRRQSAVEKIVNTIPDLSLQSIDVDDNVIKNKKIDISQNETESQDQEIDLTFEGLMSKLPLTKDQIDISKKKLFNALFIIGQTFQEKLEDYPAAIEAYENLFKRLDTCSFINKEAALFNLYYAYYKLKLNNKADSIKNVLNTNFPDGDKLVVLSQGNNTEKKEKDKLITNRYDSIYSKFQQGNCDEAIKLKAILDKQYDSTFWTPQLLYIEAICLVKQNNDSVAIQKLNKLIQLFPTSQLVSKSNTMIDVLKRRTEIENHLKTNLLIKNVDSLKTDSTKNSLNVIVKPINDFRYNPMDSQYVMIAFDNIDAAFFKEAKQSFAQYNIDKYRTENIGMSDYTINSQTRLLLLGPFVNAEKSIMYIDNTKPIAKSKIISFISTDKYHFYFIDTNNFNLLKSKNDLPAYINFIKLAVPGKF